MRIEVEILKTVLRNNAKRDVNKLTPSDVSMIKNVIYLIENPNDAHRNIEQSIRYSDKDDKFLAC